MQKALAKTASKKGATTIAAPELCTVRDRDHQLSMTIFGAARSPPSL